LLQRAHSRQGLQLVKLLAIFDVQLFLLQVFDDGLFFGLLDGGLGS
jgi:hypothetical protein